MNTRFDSLTRVSLFRPTSPRRSCRILHADGDLTRLRWNGLVLRRAGFEVDSFQDGLSAWEALRDRTYHLVVTDTRLPRLSGLEIVRRARECDLELPILMATSNLEPFSSSDMALVPIWSILLKPYTSGELLAAVNRVLPYAPSDARQNSTGSPLWNQEVLEALPRQVRHWGLNE